MKKTIPLQPSTSPLQSAVPPGISSRQTAATEPNTRLNKYQYLEIWCSALVVLLSLLALLGWTTGALWLARGIADAKSMAPSAAICLLVLGGVLLLHATRRLSGISRTIAIFMLWLVTVYGLVTCVATIFGNSHFIEEKILALQPGYLTHDAFISPAAAILILLSALGILLLLSSSSSHQRWAGYLSILVFLDAGIFVLSYLYRSPLLVGSAYIPMACTAAVAFVLLGMGIMIALNPEYTPLHWFQGQSTRKVLLRAFLPVIVIAILVSGIIIILLPAHLGVNSAVLTAVAVLVFTLLGARVAFAISRNVGEEIDRAAADVFNERERLQVTLRSIGDALIATDNVGNIVLLNDVAIQLTGWTLAEAIGHPVTDVFHIINAETRERCENPVAKVLATGLVQGLANHTHLIARDGSEYVIADSGAPIRDSEGAVIGVVLVFRDITQESILTHQMQASETRYRRLFESAKDGILILDAESGMIVDVNPFLLEMLGYSHEEFLGKKLWEIGLFTDITANEAGFLELQRQDYLRYENLPLVTKDGRRIEVEFVSNIYPVDGTCVVQCNIRDISVRMQAQRNEALSSHILQRLNNTTDTPKLLNKLLLLLKEYTGCEAVGLRLYDGEDFPYCETNGFPMHFVESERFLCARDEEQCVIHDEAGNPVLECMCGNIICGRTNPDLPFFTDGGSFWSNSTTELLTSTSEDDRQARTRNRCNGEGYESVALVPLRSGKNILGLLQFNDHRRDCFTHEEIVFLEDIGASIGIALARLQAEDARQASEERFRQMFNNMSSGVTIYQAIDDGIDFVISDFNDAAEKITGKSQHEVLGHPVTQVFPDVKDFGLFAVLQRVWRSGNPEHFPTSLYRDSELELWTENYVFRLATGEVIAIFDDITVRKQAEIQLQSTKDYLNNVINAIADPVFVKDQENCFTLLNDAMCEMLGGSREDILGTTGYELSPPEQMAMFFEKDRLVLETGQENINEELLTNAASVSRTVITKKTRYINPSGDHFLVGVVRDVTKMKQSEETLVKLYEQNQLILNSVAEGVLGLDLHGNHTFVNPAASIALGYSDEELVGYHSHNIWHHAKSDGSTYPEEECLICATYRNGIAHSGTSELFWRKDGTPFTAEFSSTPIYEHGQLSGAVVTFTDITEHLRTEEQLRQAVKMDSIGRLAGGVAHDFNNILAGISGLTELVRGEFTPPSTIYDDLSEVLELSTRAANLTRQLLSFSRAQALEPYALDFNALIKDVLKMLRRMLSENIQLVFLPDNELGTVSVDPGRIEQVLLNLTVNARDAMPSGGTLTIETRNIELDQEFANTHQGVTPGAYIQLSVSDTGCGIDEKTQQHIFEPFFTTKGVGEGSGLGLATVYGIIKQHGGNIWVYSESGYGTTFKIYLPRLDAPIECRESSPAFVISAGENTTILLVEDEQSVRSVTERMLMANGYTVLTATTPEEAVTIFTENAEEISLLLTDVVMPGYDGAELYRRLSASRPDLRVLYMSGYSRDALQATSAQQLTTHYLQKPFVVDGLLHAVGAALQEEDDLDSE